MTSTIAQVKADADRLKLALMTHLSVGETGYDDNDIVVALKHAGVKGFNGQFLGFSVLDIDDLVVPATTTAPEKPLLDLPNSASMEKTSFPTIHRRMSPILEKIAEDAMEESGGLASTEILSLKAD